MHKTGWRLIGPVIQERKRLWQASAARPRCGSSSWIRPVSLTPSVALLWLGIRFPVHARASGDLLHDREKMRLLILPQQGSSERLPYEGPGQNCARTRSRASAVWRPFGQSALPTFRTLSSCFSPGCRRRSLPRTAAAAVERGS